MLFTTKDLKREGQDLLTLIRDLRVLRGELIYDRIRPELSR
jgi:hypothetical protein